MKSNHFHNRTKRMLACLCVCAVCIANAFSDDTAAALKALQTAVEKESAQKKPGDEGMDAYGRRGDMGAMFLVQLRTAISRGEPSQLDDILNQIPAYLKSEAVREAAEKLRAALNADRAAKEQAQTTQIDAAIASASNAVKSAKKAADLDETLSSLARLQEQREERYSEKSRVRMEKVRSVRQFAVRWQDYLANRDAGNLQQAVQNLQNAANESTADIIPRSQILAMVEQLSKAKQGGADKKQDTPEQKIREILDRTKSLDAIPSALNALDELQREPGMSKGSYSDPVVAMRRALSAISQAYQEHQAGLPTQLELRADQSSQQNVDAYNSLLPLRLELLRLAVPHILDVDETMKLKADETIQQYLDRAMEAAIQHADARLIGRVRELQDKLSGKQSSGASLGFLQTLLAARNQEAAGQFLPAVISYQIVLKTGGELVPAKAIGERLEAIKSAHPAEYEKGMQLLLSNQLPPQQQNYYGSTQSVYTLSIPGSVTGRPAVSPVSSSAP